MKRKIAAILAALSIFAAVPVSATQVSDFVFNDEWVRALTHDDAYYTLYSNENCFKSKNEKLVLTLSQTENEQIAELGSDTSDHEVFNFIKIKDGFYALYAYDQAGSIYVFPLCETNTPSEWRLFADTDTLSVLLTDTKMIASHGSLDCAIYGSNFYVIRDDGYIKSNIDILSDDTFMLNFEVPDSSYNLMMLMIRSSVFGQ